MARYTGPKTKISRIFGEPILGNGKWLGKNSNPPGQHGIPAASTILHYEILVEAKYAALKPLIGSRI